MKELIYQTVCPGCGIGCGLYLREDDQGAIGVDFLKSNPVNLGKLCRFGLKLQHYYSSGAYCKAEEPASSMEDAIKYAATRLKGADKVAMLSVGNTTCEEHMAFVRIAETLGSSVHTGIQAYSKLPSECHSYLEGMPFQDIEKANRIVLFIDPYVQYPLLVRRLLAAKRNNSHIISVGTKELHLADENLSITPNEYSQLGLDSNSVIITDLHPHTDINDICQLLNLSLETGAKILVMKPFVNSEGVNRLSQVKTDAQGLSQLMDEVKKGNIKTLVLLDSDPIELMPDADETIESLKKLDNLIVISSRKSAVNEIADVVISTEPLYRKAGTFVNSEGRLQENSGTGITGINAMSSLNKELGFGEFEYGHLHEQVMAVLTNERQKSGYSKIEDLATAKQCTGGYVLKYFYNPFMWFNQLDDNDFVLINLNMVRSLKLKKGGQISLTSEKSNIKMRYRVEGMPDGLILTARKLPIAIAGTTSVKVEGC
ncbi:molybdopterin-dependent oxidoreductase [uncultured Methanomethylovorans sp.]|uniref:molybdopterin-dependent oxidoreductase n=1 Tax=uncultured Methanomethylovorans sp. TaxID=183759 RepID=UPI002AA88AD9|nr:molybdopterin-dependent oxidoreductase [uncultured Methanomethylovorans sp.]